MDIDLLRHYKRSENVISRQIESETILLPMISGVGDLDAELYSLNRTGTAVWEKLDGKKSLEEVISDLSKIFNTPFEEIKKDIISLTENLMEKDFIVEIR